MALSFSALKNRDFRFLLLVQCCAFMALQAQAVIVGWQVYSLSQSAFLLGMIGLAEAVPALCCALFSGHVVDTNKPWRIYITCIIAMFLNSLALYLIGGGIINTAHTLGFIFGAVFVSGLLRSFVMPSAFSLLGQIVHKEDMPAASAWRGSVLQMAAVTGPAVAGLLYGGYGASIAWLMPMSLMFCAAIFLMSMTQNTRNFRNKPRPESAWTSIKAGWQFILNTPVLLAVMSLDMFAVLLGGATAMLPAFADQILHIGSEGLGLLRAAPAAGAILTALYLAMRPMHHIRPRHLLLVVAGFGCCMIGFGFSTHFGAALFFLTVSGMFDSVSVVIRSTLSQWLIPDAMRGRISAVNSMFIISSNEIGAFESGLAARFLGLAPSIIAGGLGTLLVAALVAKLCPQLRTMVLHSNHLEMQKK